MRRLIPGLALLTFAAYALSSAPDWVDGLPHWFQTKFGGVAVWEWVGLVVLIITALLAAVIGRSLATHLLELRSRLTNAQFAQSTQLAVRRAAGLLSGVVVCHPLLTPLNLPARIDDNIRIVLKLATILACALLAYSLWDAVCDTIEARSSGMGKHTERLLVPMTRKFMRFLIVLLAGMIALSLFVQNIGGMIAGLGIGGLVIALAAKDSVENIFGSITILLDMPFAIGDLVRIDKIEGTVEEINLRSTRIRTAEDTVINLPNANLIRAAVENLSARRWRRVRFTTRISYDSKVEYLKKFIDSIRDYLEHEKDVVKDRTTVTLTDMDEMSLGVTVQCYINASTLEEELAFRNDFMLAIMRMQARDKVYFSAWPRPVDDI